MGDAGTVFSGAPLKQIYDVMEVFDEYGSCGIIGKQESQIGRCVYRSLGGDFCGLLWFYRATTRVTGRCRMRALP